PATERPAAHPADAHARAPPRRARRHARRAGEDDGVLIDVLEERRKPAEQDDEHAQQQQRAQDEDADAKSKALIVHWFLSEPDVRAGAALAGASGSGLPLLARRAQVKALAGASGSGALHKLPHAGVR